MTDRKRVWIDARVLDLIQNGDALSQTLVVFRNGPGTVNGTPAVAFDLAAAPDSAPSYAELAEAYRDALEHLDWTGWGDSYERECVAEDGTKARLTDVLKRLPEGS